MATDTILTAPAVGKWNFINGEYVWSIPGGTPTTPKPTQTNVVSTPETRAQTNVVSTPETRAADRAVLDMDIAKELMGIWKEGKKSDPVLAAKVAAADAAVAPPPQVAMPTPGDAADLAAKRKSRQIGRASCRERV